LEENDVVCLSYLIAGIAFAINEHFDKILLEKMHVSKADIGAYSACYKLGLFMVLFRTAYTLGIEPFSLVMPVLKTHSRRMR